MGYPLALNELARQADVDAGALSRFVNKKRDLTGETIDKVCKELGLALRPVSRTDKR